MDHDNSHLLDKNRITSPSIREKNNNFTREKTQTLFIFAVDLGTIVRYTCDKEITNSIIRTIHRRLRCTRTSGWLGA